jgi:hypothetical protein
MTLTDQLLRFGFDVARAVATATPEDVKALHDWTLDYLRKSEKAQIVGATEAGWRAVEEARGGLDRAASRLSGTVTVFRTTKTCTLTLDSAALTIPVEWPTYFPPEAPPMVPMDFYRPGGEALV